MKVFNVVDWALREHPDTRNNDKLLTLMVWDEMGLHLSDSQKDKFMSLPSTESIRRTRQKIQESGKYPAIERVRRERKFKAMQIQQVIPCIKPEKVQQTMEAFPRYM